ncbi:hypothetical protein OX283_002200 [Flavobacterium sp. SUN052]|uniref:hypothetical protein n=1 Tax=Flavobacterium sp. SUN052 TaxID=3002441 RepID=UPI00237DD921|nr:hypothetical protein [Flavobacterium sp. SUN052]MEC4003456.1 hypothetical protein [Flavobacterium sp. SUN052]
MNIIQLFEILQIDKDKTLQFTTDEIIRIEKQVNVEKKINPEIDVNVAANLIEALKNYPNEFHFISNNRILYNFFSKAELPRDKFQRQNIEVSTENVKHFISLFLMEDIDLFFDQKMAQNKFEDMHLFLDNKVYFPEDVLFKLNKKAFSKIDFALHSLSVVSADLSKILYIKQSSFYQFLSHFNSIEMDEKLKLLLNRIVDMYNINKKSEFAGTSMVSMYFYKAFDEDFAETLKKNRDVVYSNQSSSGSSGGSKYSWKSMGIVLFILVRVLLFASRCDSNSSNSYDYNSGSGSGSGSSYPSEIVVEDKVTIDPYYTEMAHKIDSFQVFLTDYNKNEIQYLKFKDTLKTGETPYENVYKNPPEVGGLEKPITFINKTKYDVVLLENPLAYDSIKMPGRTYFIRAGSSYKLRDVSDQLKRVFNFYVGNKLASFVTNSNHVFVKRNSMMEPRFTELAPNCKAILAVDYKFFDGNVSITEKNSEINITCDQVMQIVDSKKKF